MEACGYPAIILAIALPAGPAVHSLLSAPARSLRHATPLAAAGLGLIPLKKAASNETETKAALSIAFGLRLTATKDEDFNAGVVIGYDFARKSDRELDPSLKKPWISVWAGIQR